jgi:hypothetical protein
VKGCMTFRDGFMNAGVREIATTPPVYARECWGYVYSKGHVVTVSFDAAGNITVTGKEPYRSAVEKAVQRMRRKT